MKSNYKKLGPYIKEVTLVNSNSSVNYLRGISSVYKKFIKSKANIVGVNFLDYKIVKKNQFAFNPNTARMGDRIPIAINDSEDCIVSKIYPVFEVKDKNELLPQYLMLWFKRKEFDRYARFISHGSAREIFDWENMCDVELPIPSIKKQSSIVKEFDVALHKINLNLQVIDKLQDIIDAIYVKWFVNFEFPNEFGLPYKSSGGEMVWNEDLEAEIPLEWKLSNLSNFCDVKGGKRLPKHCELNDVKTGRPYIKVADMSKKKFITLHEKIEYIDDNTQKLISKYTVSAGDLIVSIVGTIGSVNVVDMTLGNANLTENCVKLTNFKRINSDFLYQYLTSTIGQRVIETKIVGGVQEKLPIYNIKSIPVLLPNESVMSKFQLISRAINKLLTNYTMQNVKLTSFKEILLSKISVAN